MEKLVRTDGKNPEGELSSVANIEMQSIKLDNHFNIMIIIFVSGWLKNIVHLSNKGLSNGFFPDTIKGMDTS